MLDVTIDGSQYILVNIDSANTGTELLKVLNDLSELMKMVNITYGKQTVLAGNSNLFFERNLEAKGGKPILKEKSVVRMVEVKEVYDLIYMISGELETYLRNHSSSNKINPQVF